MAEGYLAPRTSEQIERVLESALRAFIGGNHLAGLGTLLPYRDDQAAEVASLHTLTRFLGEGVDSHLVRFAAERASCESWTSCSGQMRRPHPELSGRLWVTTPAVEGDPR